MSAEYKVTKGIYMRKYQAKKYLGSRWCVRGETEDSKEFRNVNFTLRNFRNVNYSWCSCLPKAISSSFQLQIIHGLKLWIFDFLSFQMIYSMQKIDFVKCFKSEKEDCSCFLHSVFLFSIACARVSTWNSSL